VKPTRVVIEEVPAESRAIVVEGRTLLRGQLLSALLKELGGYEGEVVQPTTGRHFTISLEPWRATDPDATWLELSFVTDS
jgi:hypothetical protein